MLGSMNTELLHSNCPENLGDDSLLVVVSRWAADKPFKKLNKTPVRLSMQGGHREH